MNQLISSQASQLQIDLTSIVNVKGHAVLEKNIIDIPLLSKKLGSSVEVPQVKQFLAKAKEANAALVLAEAQTNVLQSWRSFLQVVLLRQKAKAPSSASVKDLIEGLAAHLKNETREGPVIEMRNEEISSLLLSLLWYWVTQLSQVSEVLNRDKIVSNLTLFLIQLSSLSQPSPSLVSSLLTCLLLLSRATSPSEWKQLAQHVANVIPAIIRYLKDESLQKVVVGIFDVFVYNLELESKVLRYFQNEDIIPLLMEQLTLALQDATSFPFANSILHLFHSLSGILPTAECLTAHRLLMVLSDKSCKFFQELSPYDGLGERNLGHRIWCLMLRLVTHILNTLETSETTLTQALEFVSIHRLRMMTVLESPNSITLAELEELECVTALLYQITFNAQRWKFIFMTSDVTSQLVWKTLQVIQQFSILLTSPTHIYQVVKPMSKEDRQIAFPPNPSSTPSTSLVSSLPLATSRPVEVVPSAAFVLRIEFAMYDVLQNAISIVQLITLKYQAEDPKGWKPLFTPLMEISPLAKPSIGALFGLMNVLINSKFKKLGKENKSDSEEISKAKSQLIYIVENALTVVLSHFELYLHTMTTSNQRRIRDELGDELESFLGRLNRDFQKATFPELTQSGTGFIKRAEERLKATLSSSREKEHPKAIRYNK